MCTGTVLIQGTSGSTGWCVSSRTGGIPYSTEDSALSRQPVSCSAFDIPKIRKLSGVLRRQGPASALQGRGEFEGSVQPFRLFRGKVVVTMITFGGGDHDCLRA